MMHDPLLYLIMAGMLSGMVLFVRQAVPRGPLGEDERDPQKRMENLKEAASLVQGAFHLSEGEGRLNLPIPGAEDVYITEFPLPRGGFCAKARFHSEKLRGKQVGIHPNHGFAPLINRLCGVRVLSLGGPEFRRLYQVFSPDPEFTAQILTEDIEKKLIEESRGRHVQVGICDYRREGTRDYPPTLHVGFEPSGGQVADYRALAELTRLLAEQIVRVLSR